MIFAFAIEPAVAAEWYSRPKLRSIRNEIGLGHPRVFLEYPKFSRWKRAVWNLLEDRDLSPTDRARVEELFKWLAGARVRRPGVPYDPEQDWLVNAEGEWGRRGFGGILATSDPRDHTAVITEVERQDGDDRWEKGRGVSVARSAADLVRCLGSVLEQADELHLVDPYFDGHKTRNRTVLTALAAAMVRSTDTAPQRIVIHCAERDVSRDHFERGARRCEGELPARIEVRFRRWRRREGGDRMHNRYVLADFGGVSLGIGVEEGEPGETDDVSILSDAQWEWRWSQYCDGTQYFEPVDDPDLPIITGRG